MITRQMLKEYVNDPNVAAFLHVIREGETSNDPIAYRTFYGNTTFDSYADHPRKKFPLPDGRTTSAAGAYQFEKKTWDNLVSQYGFTDFSPESQDQAAVALLIGRKALLLVKEGKVNEAVRLLPKEWTSLALPKRIQAAPEIFVAYGGTLAEADAPRIETPVTKAEVKPVGVDLLFAAISAFGPSIAKMIPALGSLFGSGTPVQQRNVQALGMAADALVTATNSPNLQAAVEAMQNDPAALQAATEAIHEILPQLMDVGGGVESARKFASEHENSRYGRILEVVTYCAMFFLLLANCLSAAAAYLLMDASVLADVKQADIGAALIAFGYFLGSSISSKRKDEMKGSQ